MYLVPVLDGTVFFPLPFMTIGQRTDHINVFIFIFICFGGWEGTVKHDARSDDTSFQMKMQREGDCSRCAVCLLVFLEGARACLPLCGGCKVLPFL